MPEHAQRAAFKRVGPAQGADQRDLQLKRTPIPRAFNGHHKSTGHNTQTHKDRGKRGRGEATDKDGASGEEKAPADKAPGRGSYDSHAAPGPAQPLPGGPLALTGARTVATALLVVAGKIRGTPGQDIAVKPMVDSGASGIGFIDTEFANRCGLKLRSSTRRVALADGSIVAAAGEVDVTYALDAKSGQPLELRSTFIATPLQPYEIILGLGWLEQHHANVAFHERSMQLRINGEGEQRAIRVTERRNDDGTIAATPLRLTAMSSRGFFKAYKHGKIENVSAVFIRPTKEAEAEASEPDKKPVPGADQPAIRKLLDKFMATVFPDTPPPGVPPNRGVEHSIDLKPGSRPPTVRPLRHGSSKDAQTMQQYIEDGLRSGMLLPSTSPYGSMALVVLKKDGTPRVVIDYRALNEITIKNKYPLPLMDELFDRVAGAKFFTKIDLKSGFHQIAIRPEDREKTAFRTRYGSFEYTVLPMGLCNAPATFMQLMNQTFADMLDKHVLCFLDDILIYSNTEEEHLRHVEAVLRRLQESRLYAKLSKCEFMQREVEFLGHRIGADGLRVSPDKIGAVQQWPVPRNVRDVRSFLGLANFYRRFVEGYSRIALPLTELTKDEASWSWGTPQQQAFDTLKAKLCEPPVLLIGDQSKPFALNCDACDHAIGAVLQQDQGNGLQPVAFFSQKLTSAERNYDVREREFMAIYRACIHWRPYLHGIHPFQLLSDHRSLTYFMSMNDLTGRLARWQEKMAEFDCGITYIKGEHNVVADALSRRADHAIEAQRAVALGAARALPPTDAAEVEAQRRRNILAAERVAPPAPGLPKPDRHGTINTPTQRCTADTAKGEHCSQRTAISHLCWNHLQRDKGVRVRKSTVPGAGRGLFVAWSAGLPAGHNIPYTGDEILLPKGVGGPYVLQMKKGHGIDAARRNAGVARFVNDPRGGVDSEGRQRAANCKFVVHTPAGTSQRVGSVRTLRPIEKGEELLIAYGDGYCWGTEGAEAAAPPPSQAKRTKRSRGDTRRTPIVLAAMTRSGRRTPAESQAPPVNRQDPSPPRAGSEAPPEAAETLVSEARGAAQKDAEYAAWLASPPPGTKAERGLLFEDDGRMRVPNDVALRTRILAELHDGATGAHAGRDRMTAAAQQRFAWKGIGADIERYTTTCDACQRNKHSKQLKPGLMMPLPLPEEPCLHWTTDAVTGLPRTKRGHTSIQVYVDRLTKLKRFAATKHTDTAPELAATTMRTIIGPHGMPLSIVSDRDPRITSRMWRELQRLLGCKTQLSTANHPQTDGQSEREIQTLITALRSYVNDAGDDWDEFLPAMELAFNSKVQASTGASPFYLVYGQQARLPIDCMLDAARPSPVQAATDRAERIRKALDAARSHTELAQERQKRAADRHRRSLDLNVGDLVMLATEGLTLRSGMHKLTARFIGPFKIVDKVNDNAITLELPPLLSALHPTVNISRLKPYRDGKAAYPDRPQRLAQPAAVTTDTNGVPSYEVERIIAQKGKRGQQQLLVRWTGYGAEDDSWELRRELVKSAPRKVEEFDAQQLEAAAAISQDDASTDDIVHLHMLSFASLNEKAMQQQAWRRPMPMRMNIGNAGMGCRCGGRKGYGRACRDKRCPCRRAGVTCGYSCFCMGVHRRNSQNGVCCSNPAPPLTAAQVATY